jgi:hypothetical protein
MKKSDSRSGKHLLEVVRLLEQIVGAFKDPYSRPEKEIALYARYQELRKSHEAKLVGRFIVITGGAKPTRWLPSRRVLRPVSMSKQQLKARQSVTKS